MTTHLFVLLKPGLALGKYDFKSEDSEYRSLDDTHPPQY